jgi:hypothetical protein
MATNWICNYAVVQATLPGIENLGYKFWIIWVRLQKKKIYTPSSLLSSPKSNSRQTPLPQPS